MKTLNTAQEVPQTILANQYLNFKPQTGKGLPVVINPNQERIPELFRDYDYPVSCWPVIINQDQVTQLAKLSVVLPRLIRTIPSMYFQNDIGRLAEFYYAGDQTMTQFAMMANKKNIEISCRLDLTLTKSGFKVLEANIGSSIGGWQVQSFEAIIRELHDHLTSPTTADQFESRNIQKVYMKFLVDKILESVSGIKDVVNVFVSLGNIENERINEAGLKFFDDLLKAELHRRGLQGQAITGEMDQIKMLNKKLVFEENVIHSVIILSLDRGQVPPILFRAFIMDSIYFPDHLGANMYGDKRNLAILRQLAEQKAFTDDENELVLNAVPWTVPFKTTTVLFQGEKQSLIELLKNNKDQFVIKAANGFQGKDVFVGNFLTATEWTEAIEIASAEDEFIVQEYCESLEFLAPNSLRQWTPHDLIWGSFGFGEAFGGTWVRMSEKNGGLGVINSATGAVEAIVYEQAAL